MQVDIRVGRQFVIDHRSEVLDVQSTRGDVARDEHAAAAVGEAYEYFVAIALLDIAMQRQCGNAELGQRFADIVGVAARVAEHHARFRTMLQQQRGQRRGFAREIGFMEPLLDGWLLDGAGDSHFKRIAQRALRHRADRFRISRREQQALSRRRRLADDFADRLLETHVEHAVCFIEHQRLHLGERQRLFAQHLLDASGRADDDVRILAQRGELRRQRNAAGERKHFQIWNRARETANFARNLIGQLARRAQHQRLYLEQCRIEALQQPQAECDGLAATGRCLRDQVATREHRWQALRLHRRHGGVVERGQRLEQRRRKRQRRKFGHARMIACRAGSYRAGCSDGPSQSNNQGSSFRESSAFDLKALDCRS